jgi:hypothetical protein
MPALNNFANNRRSDVDHRGDLFATLKVQLPSEFTDEEIDLFRMLRDKRMNSPELETAGDNGVEDEGTGKEY